LTKKQANVSKKKKVINIYEPKGAKRGRGNSIVYKPNKIKVVIKEGYGNAIKKKKFTYDRRGKRTERGTFKG
jgi:hypothetical protein